MRERVRGSDFLAAIGIVAACVTPFALLGYFLQASPAQAAPHPCRWLVVQYTAAHYGESKREWCADERPRVSYGSGALYFTVRGREVAVAGNYSVEEAQQ